MGSHSDAEKEKKKKGKNMKRVRLAELNSMTLKRYAKFFGLVPQALMPPTTTAEMLTNARTMGGAATSAGSVPRPNLPGSADLPTPNAEAVAVTQQKKAGTRGPVHPHTSTQPLPQVIYPQNIRTKGDLVKVVERHFERMPVDEFDTIGFFCYAVKNQQKYELLK